MSFLLFLVYYVLCSLIFVGMFFILYKLFFKKLIADKLTFSNEFFTDSIKSITDINFEKEEEKKEDEKIPTYF